jgi:YVTN family beta-propeller protein
VAIEYQNEVQIINTTLGSVVGNITGISYYPWTVVSDPVNGYIYVSETYYSTINVYDQNNGDRVTVIQLPVGSGTPIGPEGMTLDPANGYLYVDNTHFSTVSVINTTTNKIQYTINVSLNPGGSFYDPANQDMYVFSGNDKASNVSVIDTANQGVISTFQVGKYTEFGAYDPGNGYLYFSNFGSNNVTIVNPEDYETVANINVGEMPYQIAFDPQNYNMYVANYHSSTISIVHPVSNVVFTETGLKPGTDWSFTINGKTFSSANKSISLYANNGIYNYTISNINGYGVNKESGTLSVNGSSITTNVIFSNKLYEVTFYEKGLPLGTSWTVNLENNTNSSTSGNIGFAEVNGTYNYAIAASESQFVPAQATGKIVINGNSSIYSVVFYKNITYVPLGSGMAISPNGTYAYVVETGSNEILKVNLVSGISVGDITSVTEPSAIAITPNGSYALVTSLHNDSVLMVNLVTGNIVKSPNAYNLPSYGIAISPSGAYAYMTLLDESHVAKLNISGGYLAGNITSFTYNSRGIALNPNGSLAYITNGAQNSITVMNLVTGQIVKNLTVYDPLSDIAVDPNGSVAFVTGFRTDNLSEINLSSGSIIKNYTGLGKPDAVTISPNGTYAYVLNNTAISRITISKAYQVTVTESGLPPGTEWFLNLSDGYSYKSNSSTISFTTSNNTYEYSAESGNTDYRKTPGTGLFTVRGSDVSVSASFTGITYEAIFTESSLPPGSVWYVNISGRQPSGPITGTTYSVGLINGTYNYNITTSQLYYTTTSGSFKVKGNSVSVTAVFTDNVYKVTFTESGLPSGTEWFANLTAGQ